MAKKPYPSSWAHPRYWPTWGAIALMYLAAWLPWSLKLALGRGLGLLAWRFAKRRRHITETNIRLCFPELNPQQQADLVKRTFIANGIGLLETATAWCRSVDFMRQRMQFTGTEHLQKALAQGKGAIILGIHFSTLDLGGALHGLLFDVDVIYRRHDNPLFEAFMTRSRERIFGAALDRRDLRAAIKRIKSGRGVWYSPDQDFGADVSVFAPFFGQTAASIKMTSRLAKMTGAPVLPLMFHRNPDDFTYRLEYLPPLDPFPTGDEVADATQVNAFIEQAIRRHPEQYLWLHRRFKTRPPGEASVY